MNDIIKLAEIMGNPPAPAPDPPSKFPGYDAKAPSLKDEKKIQVPTLEEVKYPKLPANEKTPFKVSLLKVQMMISI